MPSCWLESSHCKIIDLWNIHEETFIKIALIAKFCAQLHLAIVEINELHQDNREQSLPWLNNFSWLETMKWGINVDTPCLKYPCYMDPGLMIWGFVWKHKVTLLASPDNKTIYNLTYGLIYNSTSGRQKEESLLSCFAPGHHLIFPPSSW